ncbi:MAG: hypothetical protein OEQ53_14940, partial [Saprospiraceae bacterium]|nr:hypothetical protein [Saprospiraceae bacterium]
MASFATGFTEPGSPTGPTSFFDIDQNMATVQSGNVPDKVAEQTVAQPLLNLSVASCENPFDIHNNSINCSPSGHTVINFPDLGTGYSIVFAGSHYDMERCRTYFFYCINNGDDHDISHTGFYGGLRCLDQLNMCEVGTWKDGSADVVTLRPGNGNPKVGIDPSCDIPEGIKFDESTTSQNCYYLSFEGNVGVDPNGLMFNLKASTTCAMEEGPGPNMCEGPCLDTITIDCPDDKTMVACATQDQIDQAFQNWLDEFTFDKGDCDNPIAIITPINPQAPDQCGGMIEITYTVFDPDCDLEGEICVRKFIVPDVDDVVFTCPDDEDCSSCKSEAFVLDAFEDW